MERQRRLITLSLALVLAGCGSGPGADSVHAAGEQPSVWSRLLGKRTYTLPEGTALRVRLNQSLDTARNQAGDPVSATLESPVAVGETVVIPRGTAFHGRVLSAKPSGRLTGRGYLTVTLDSFELNGTRYRITTSAVSRVSAAHGKRNAVLIGGGTGVGALIGGLAGGGKGAAIGALAGAAAGTAGAAATGERNAVIPAETIMRFTLKAPIQVKG